MHSPIEMSLITIASHREHLRDVIETLYRLKVLHIDEYKTSNEDYFSIGSPLENAEKISELLIIIQSLKSQLSVEFRESAGKEQMSLEKAESYLNGLSNEMRKIEEEEKEADAAIKKKKNEIKTLGFLRAAGVENMSILGFYKSLEMACGYADSLDAIKKKLKDHACQIIAPRKKTKGGTAFMVFFKKTESDPVRKALFDAGFVPNAISIDLPAGKVSERISAVQKEINVLEAKSEEIRRRLKDVSGKNRQKVLSIEAMLLEEIKKSEAPLKFGSGKNVFFIKGWLPSNKGEELAKAISAISPNIYYKIDECADEAPIQLGNASVAQPFEFFLRLYSLPSYREIDPTFILMFSFPILFGVMLGDIGYGLVLLVSFAVMNFVLGKMKTLSIILMISAVSTIIFGFVFGEFFGEEQILGHHLIPYLNRIKNLNGMLVVAIVFGLVHVNIGLITGIFNEFRHHGMRGAFGKASWLLLEAGGLALILNMYSVTSIEPMIGYALLLAGLAGLGLGEGVVGLIEIPALASNILSYTRLAAVGLASASLAIIINEMAGEMFHLGGFFIAVGIMVLIIGHGINTLLGLMDAFLQSLRLHYVEMFTKFYKGSGEQYKPFG